MKLALKSTLMVLFTFVATSITTTGWPATGIEWAIFGIASLGTVITHIAQSVTLPTTSVKTEIDWRDLLKGAIVSVGNFLSMFAASYLPGAHVDFAEMAKSAGSVFILYILKQIATKPKTA